MKWSPTDCLKFKFKAAIYVIISVAVREISCRPKVPWTSTEHFKNEWIDAVVPQLRDLQPNQVSIFSENIRKPLKRYEKEKLRVINQLIRKISDFSSVMVVDYAFSNIPSENRFLDSPYLKFVNNSTLILMIHELEKKKDLFHSLKFFHQVYGRKKQPRTLVIYLNTRIESIDYACRLFVQYAWSLIHMKEYSLLAVTNSTTYLYTYDMFDKTHMIAKFNHSVKIFPDKTASLKKYEDRHYDFLDSEVARKFSRQIFNRFETANFFKRQFSYNITIEHYDELYNLKYWTERAGFVFSRDILKGGICFSPFMDYVMPFVAIVPILKKNRHFEFPVDIALQISTFFVVAGVYVVIAIIFRFPRDMWTYENIYQTLLGYSALPSLKKLTEKIIYLSIVVMSLTLISELIFSISEIGFVEDSYSYNTWSKVNESRYMIFIEKYDIPIYFETEEDYPEEISEKKLLSCENIFIFCILHLKRNDRACICQNDFLNHINAIYSKLGIIKYMNDFEIVEESHRKVHTFMTFDPILYEFINEIHKTYFNLFETGHTVDGHFVTQHVKASIPQIRFHDYSGCNAMPLIFVSIIGTVIACMVFIFEFVCWHMSLNKYDEILAQCAQFIREVFVQCFKFIQKSVRKPTKVNFLKRHPNAQTNGQDSEMKINREWKREIFWPRIADILKDNQNTSPC